jgi:hypothetical protein
MTKLKAMAVRDMRFKRITIPVLNHQINIANPNAMKVSVILGFQCLLARNLPSRRHANLRWQGVVFDWQKVQSHKGHCA